MKLSKRKLESYRRAEMVAQECRYQFADNRRNDIKRISDLVIHWMRSTGNVKYDRPVLPKNIIG